MSRPTLYVFAISHYCEKARWALDYHGIAYQLRHLAPGPHMQVARKLGAPASSMPYLTLENQLVHGSAAVVDWADEHSANQAPALTPNGAASEECRAIERRLDTTAGVHVRRFFYSEAIVDHPGMVRPVFTRDLPLLQKAVLSLGWGKVRAAMMQRMDLGPKQRLDSRAVVDAELAWLDGLLADGRPYLVGERFTRADLAAASLLAPLANPPEHPVYAGLELPPLYAADVQAWAERPALRHARRMYSDHR